ncbi:putative reverse transcriptase domain-containing protein [Tanacetum coccineum]
MYDPDDDLEEDDEDPEEDPVDHPTDRDDDEDEEEEESSGDEANDEADDEDEDKEEEHPAPTDSIPPPPPPAYREEAERFLAIPTPPPSPLTPLSSPLPQIPSPPLLVSPPLPTSLTHPLGYKTAMIWLRAEAPSTFYSLPLPPPIILSRTRSDAPPLGTPPSGTPPLLPIPVPTSSLPLMLPFTDRRAVRPEVYLPPRKRMCIALVPREIRRDLEREDGYRIIDSWDEIVEAIQDTDEIYGRLDEAQEARAARISQEAWRRSMDASHTAQSEVMALRTIVLVQQAKIVALRATDRTRQPQIVEALRLMSTLQTQVTALQRQQGPARDPAQPDVSEEAVVYFTKRAPKRTTRSTPTITTPTTTSVTDAMLKAMIDQGVTTALAARDADRNMNGDDSHNSGTGVRRTERVARECTYPDFMRCQPLNFKGTKGVVELMQWFERMETMFRISNCTDAIEMATELMDKKISTLAKRHAEKKRKFDDTSRNNQNQQQPPKRNNVARAYAAGSGEKKPYGGSKPLCPKCNYHHDGPCAPKCHKSESTCYECGAQGHFKRECPKLKSNNQGNPYGNGNAPAKVYVLGNAGTNPNANAVTGTFLLKNRYASILFDTGAERSFVSTTFSSQIDNVPTALYYCVDVELADGRII